MIKEELEGTPALLQALYFAMGTVSDHSLSADVSVAAGIAECIDRKIRKEKLQSWISITISLNVVNMDTQLGDLLFLYSSINAKEEFVKTYNVLLSRRLLFSRVYNLDVERMIISVIRNK